MSADCERLTPEAIPLARIAPVSPGEGGADGFHLAADDDYLYFASEARIWRVSKRAGAPEPLTPEGSAGGNVHVTADAIVWSIQGEIRRAPIEGGAPETVVTFPSPPLWTVAGDAILSSEPQNKPAPVLRTPFAGDGGSSPVLMISGFPISMALDGQTLYANIALPIPGSNMFSGALVRRPSADGALVVMTKTDAKSIGSSIFSWMASGLAVDEANVYFIELCAASDPDFGSYRLVSLPKDHMASP